MRAISSWRGELTWKLPRAPWWPHLGWPYPPRAIDVAWTVFALVNLDFMFMFPCWETVPFHIIWASLTLVYGFRTWNRGPTLWVASAVLVVTALGITFDVAVGSEPATELTEDPLLALMFLAMAWHAHRRLAADRSHQLISEHNARLLDDQRRFLQDAAHQLRTPITIALGHAELIADAVGPTGDAAEPMAGAAGGQRAQLAEDIDVVVGELNRLRRISERLLIIAAAADPAFLHPEPVALDQLVVELVRRWQPAADRSWRIGRLDHVIVPADRERLGLALDALLENAVRHTLSTDVIQLSVIRDYPGMPTRIVVADTGSGIPADQVPLIFDRFSTGDDGQRHRGTGLGLPLVRAVARAHGGNVTVSSTVGEGSAFELTLPTPVGTRLALAAGEAGQATPTLIASPEEESIRR
ncbi:MAG TPA: HAMP domain-containing sensor histidine kinase [Trebonia sp.]|nr:HAMP domain-containing sensor histidine kinase [Trebonia sp.]